MFDSARQLVLMLCDLGSTRVELAVTELEEERQRLTSWILTLICALFFFAMTVLLLTVFVILASWNYFPLLTVGLLCLVFAGMAIALCWRSHFLIKNKPRMLYSTLLEIQKDIAMLRTTRQDKASSCES